MSARAAASSASALADVLVDELVRAGVREAVCAPGSRSAPLALALFAAARTGRLRLHVRVDERSAGFTALGLAKVSGLPVPVVTTSGTAVAELHPAVLEAAHAGVPLLVVSADRPLRLRDTGANQTTTQTRIFGTAASFVELTDDPRARSGWRAGVCRALAATRTGPAQLNVCLDEPLIGEPAEPPPGRPDGSPWTRPALPAAQRQVGSTDPLPGDRLTVLVAGDGDPATGAEARALAEAHGWPVLAEPSSNARAGRNALATYRLLLAARTGLAAQLRAGIDRVLVVGRPTLSRPVTALLADPRVEVVVVADPRSATWPDVAGSASRVVTELPTVTRSAGRSDRRWLGRWQTADHQVAARLAAVDADGASTHGVAVAARVAAAATRADQLVLGSSNPVRDLDLAPVWPAERAPRVLANRGLAGIDGMVSTAAGAALAGGATLALLGDLTFLHDANGLLLGPAEPRPDLRLVVANDDGGSIFHTLEQGEPAYADAFERVFGTPHGADLAARSAAVGVPHRQVSTLADLEQALARPIRGVDVLEVLLTRHDRRALDDQLRSCADGLHD